MTWIEGSTMLVIQITTKSKFEGCCISSILIIVTVKVPFTLTYISYTILLWRISIYLIWIKRYCTVVLIIRNTITISITSPG